LPNIIGLYMEKGKKVSLREDTAFQMIFPMHKPNAVRVWTHSARTKIEYKVTR
jgi:hypothetical protein